MNKISSISRRRLLQGALCGLGACAAAYGFQHWQTGDASKSDFQPDGPMTMNTLPALA